MTSGAVTRPDDRELAAAGLGLTVEGPVATLVLDRPEVRNAQTPTMWRMLAAVGEALLADDTVLATYRVSLGGAPVGHKQQEGDERTPEGTYVLDWRNAESIAHRSIHVAYPDAADTTRADSAGVSPGGQIMIHGITNGLGWLGRLHRLADWTDGCIGVTNAEMDQIWDAVPDGTPIEIRP